MKTYRLKAFLFVALSIVYFVMIYPQSSKDASILFYRGQQLEEVKGELAEAIKVYQHVLEKFPDERGFAAKALLRIGVCYTKLGNQQAQEAFERIVQEYGDQLQIAAEAQTRLQVLKKPMRLISSEGMVSRQIWADIQTDPSGSISPDGRYLTFTDWFQGNLYVRDLTTGFNRKLTQNPSGSLDFANFSKWSPDGRKIAYYWNVRPYSDLRIIGMDGSNPKTIFHDETVIIVVLGGWSPDGKSISVCFEEKRTTIQTIALINVDTGEVKDLKSVNLEDSGLGPFSPDGRYIVYDRPQEKDVFERDIFLLATDGSGEVPLIEHPSDDRILCLSRDGKWLFYCSNRSGMYDAWIVKVENGKQIGSPQLIKPGIGDIISLGLTDDGVFHYSKQTRNRDPYVVDFDPESSTVISEPKRVNQRFIGSGRHPDWSPDGKLLAYLSGRTTNPTQGPSLFLVIQSLDTGKERDMDLSGYLDFPAMYLRWFPDNRSLLVYAKDKEGKRGLHRINAQTAEVSLLFYKQPGEIFWYPSISPAGDEVFYSSIMEQGRLSRIVGKKLGTGEEKVLYETRFPHKIRAPALSPDGRKIVANYIEEDSSPNTDILLIIPTEGGEPIELMREIVTPGNKINDRTGLAWTADGSHVLFSRWNDNKELSMDIWALPIQGGTPKKLGLTLTGLQYIRFHPDGKQFCFTAGRFIDEIWMLENFLPKR